MTLFLALVVTHFLVDFPLQGDFLAKGKNHRAPLPGVPWWYCLIAHAAICAGAVAACVALFGYGQHRYDFLVAALCEFLAHLQIDYHKNEGTFGKGESSFLWDQGFHLGYKLVWAAIASA